VLNKVPLYEDVWMSGDVA